MIPHSRLRRTLDDANLDVVVASSPTNVFSLTGLESLTQDLLGERAFAIRTAAGDGPDIVLPATDASIIVDTDVAYETVYTYGSFYIYRAETIDEVDERVLQLKDEHNFEDPLDALLAALAPHVDGDRRVALEQTGLSPAENERIADELDVDDLQPAADVLQEMRRIKTDEEQARLRRSVEINQASIRAAVDELEPGMTERELANRYREHLCARGAEPLFTVVGFGPHGAYPHAVPGDRQLGDGDLIRFDVGCTYENYSSDIARTFAYRSADDEVRRKYETLSDAMDRTIELVAEHEDTAAVFEGTLEFVRNAGTFEDFDRNHVGHGIGIEVYDPPTITAESNPIHPGMVLCVEPPYYELGTGGIQVEDEIIVTEDGVERLSQCEPELRVVG